MPRRAGFVCVLLCLALLLGGCSSLSIANTADLLRAPALGEDPGAIQRALVSYLAQEPQYKYPREGDWHSPLMLADLTGDGVDEGIVLYSEGEAGSTYANIAILQKDAAGEWQVMATRPGASTEIASIEVADMLGDGTKVLLVGYTRAAGGSKTFGLYQYAGGELSLLRDGPYESFLLGDFADTGATDLAIASSVDGSLLLTFLTGQGGEIDYRQDASIQLASSVTSCLGLYASVNAEGQRFLVIDVEVGASGMRGSQILVYSGRGQYYLKGQGDDASQIQFVTETLRSRALAARDIDGDGTVEIPVPFEEPEFELDAEALSVYFIEWRDYTLEEAEGKQFGLYHPEHGLYVRLPSQWRTGLRVVPTGSGWRLRQPGGMVSLLEYRVLNEGDELPEGAILVEGISQRACLIPSAQVSPLEARQIETIVLG